MQGAAHSATYAKRRREMQVNAVNRRPRAPATAPERRDPKGRTEEQAVLVTFFKKKVTRRKGEKVIQKQREYRIC